MVPGPLSGLHILHKPSHFFGCSGSSILSLRLSCPAACRILVPLPGKEPTFKALEGRFLTTRPPGKSLHNFLTSSILQPSAEPTQLRGERPVLIGLLFLQDFFQFSNWWIGETNWFFFLFHKLWQNWLYDSYTWCDCPFISKTGSLYNFWHSVPIDILTLHEAFLRNGCWIDRCLL